MSGSGHGGAASGLGSSCTVNARSQGRRSQVSPYLSLLWLSGLLKGISESDSENIHGNGLGHSSSALSPKGRLLMKPDPHAARRVQSSSVTGNIPQRCDAEGWSSQLLFRSFKQRGDLGMQALESLGGRAACG